MAAAEQGNEIAQFILGDSYYNGDGLPWDYDEAAKWYGRSASQYYAPAMYAYAVCCENGVGVEQNWEQAGISLPHSSPTSRPSSKSAFAMKMPWV